MLTIAYCRIQFGIASFGSSAWDGVIYRGCHPDILTVDHTAFPTVSIYSVRVY